MDFLVCTVNSSFVALFHYDTLVKYCRSPERGEPTVWGI